MLRVLPQRLGLVPYHLISRRFSPASATVLKVDGEEGTEDEAYGTDYGAGPSRFPYNPPAPQIERSQYPSTDNHALHPAESNRRSAQALRRALDGLRQSTHNASRYHRSSPYDSDTDLELALGLTSPLHTSSRLDLHVILHHLIRHKRHLGPLASRIIRESIKHGRGFRTQRRRIIAYGTLVALLRDPRKFNLFLTPALRPPSSPRIGEPTIADHAPASPSRQLASLLDLLETLQSVRNRRPIELYDLLIRQCVAEGRPDVAAKVYVGMVEEWIVEGRVAEGLDPDKDFHEGGGPPRDARSIEPEVNEKDEAWNLRRELRMLYWKTVRRWTLPGEVLSPHDRLDLWHPRNLSLSEKLRNFPYPCPQSPPMLVPLPDDRLLSMILRSLHLDPETASPADFAASMRACAMLASTILNRTLPILSQAKVLDVLGSTPRQPPIYPENMTEPPSKDDAWAYEAYTHIHLALQSLFFNLPVHGAWVRFINASEQAKSAGLPPPPPPIPRLLYMSPPLCYRACITMIGYGLRKLRRPQVLGKILGYIKKAFGMGPSPSLVNQIFRGSTLARANSVVDKIDHTLFGTSRLAKERTTSVRGRFAEQGYHYDRQGPNELVLPTADQPISPDLISLLALIPHLTATSQFDRLEQATYDIMPFLVFSKRMTPEQLHAALEELSIKPGWSGRPRHHSLPLHLYAVLLVGLEKSSRNSLASRVFRLALQAEGDLAFSHYERHPDVRIPSVSRLGIEPFTTMLLVWDNELRASADRQRQPSCREKWPQGWSVPSTYARLPRRVAAQLMIFNTYDMVRSRWQTEALRPDVRFFNAMIRASRSRWELHSDTLLEGVRARELERVVLDMWDFKVPVPVRLKAKLGWIDFPINQSQREKDQRARNDVEESRAKTDREREYGELRRLAEMRARGEDGVLRWPLSGEEEDVLQEEWEELEEDEVVEVNDEIGQEKGLREDARMAS